MVGAILGDACLERNGRNVRLRIDHGHAQQALVEWKFQQLTELDPSPVRRVDVFDSRTKQTYVHYRFATKTTALLNEWHDLFYRDDSIKRVPEQIATYLNSALSIAVWYMDDGGRRGDCRSGYLNTQAFTPEEVSALRACLRDNFDIETTTHFAAGRPRIYIASAQFEQFCELVRPHIIPQMQYKLL
jgi:hypothetical protein